ncbi:hypothetical protein Tco_0144967 [Tanacetum coccineum]
MTTLKYVDKHNMVAFLKKPNERVGFTKIVDFLKGTSLMYALTHNPTIYDSLVKQFWQTATVRTLANGTPEVVSSIDNKEYTITEASVRSKLQLADAAGISNLPDAEIFDGLATLGGYAGEYVPLLPAMLAGAAEDQERAASEKDYLWESGSHSSRKDEVSGSSLEKKDKESVSLVRESMKEKDTDFVTPTKTSALGEVQEQDISPTTLEATKSLSQVISQKAKSTDKGIRYKRKTRSKSIEKDISTDLDADIEVNPGSEDLNTGNEDFNTATKRTKAQIQQEEVGLAEAMRLQALQEEEAARQVHLDAFLAKRISGEEELSEQQKKRKVEVQEVAQFYIEEDWDTIRAKLEANAELTKSLQGESMTSKDFAKRMVEMINQKKKFYAEQKAKARRSKPMTQAQQRDYIKLYRLVIKKYGANRPEEMYDRVLWGDVKNMFDPPLSDDAIWSLPLQQKKMIEKQAGLR